MIVDSSAMMAILKNEPEALPFLDAMARASRCLMSAGTWIEMTVVLERSGDAVARRAFERLVEAVPIGVAPVTVEQGHVGADAYRRHGRGTGDKAKLNFGDCFPYALAKTADQHLLFKGDDFVHTDVKRASY